MKIWRTSERDWKGIQEKGGNEIQSKKSYVRNEDISSCNFNGNYSSNCLS
jgi:hypothetical protein